MSETIKAADLPKLVGQEIAPSAWVEITQQRVNKFAEATNDHQFIHVDPEKAAETPFGGTIAHGYLTLSLIPALTAENMVMPEGLVMGINYGSDRVRFMQPVPVGSRVRALQDVLEVTQKKPGQFLIRTRVTIELEGSAKPALIAETLGLFITR